MSFITLLSCSNNIGRQITNTHRAYYVQTYFTVHNTLPSVYVNNNINNCISLLYIQSDTEGQLQVHLVMVTFSDLYTFKFFFLPLWRYM